MNTNPPHRYTGPDYPSEESTSLSDGTLSPARPHATRDESYAARTAARNAARNAARAAARNAASDLQSDYFVAMPASFAIASILLK
jgi:hypothetical protein